MAGRGLAQGRIRAREEDLRRELPERILPDFPRQEGRPLDYRGRFARLHVRREQDGRLLYRTFREEPRGAKRSGRLPVPCLGVCRRPFRRLDGGKFFAGKVRGKCGAAGPDRGEARGAIRVQERIAHKGHRGKGRIREPFRVPADEAGHQPRRRSFRPGRRHAGGAYHHLRRGP